MTLAAHPVLVILAAMSAKVGLEILAYPRVLPLRQRFIDRWRAIQNAAEGTVTTCDSVTQGLHMVVDALPELTWSQRAVAA